MEKTPTAPLWLTQEIMVHPGYIRLPGSIVPLGYYTPFYQTQGESSEPWWHLGFMLPGTCVNHTQLLENSVSPVLFPCICAHLSLPFVPALEYKLIIKCLHRCYGLRIGLSVFRLSHLHCYLTPPYPPQFILKSFQVPLWGHSLIMKPAVVSQCLQYKIPSVHMSCPVCPPSCLDLFIHAFSHSTNIYKAHTRHQSVCWMLGNRPSICPPGAYSLGRCRQNTLSQLSLCLTVL